MQSIDSLRELNAKLLVEITKLRKKFSEIKIENDKFKDKNSEIPELRRKFAEIEGVKENKRRDAENIKLKARIEKLENVEFRDRIMKVEQKQMLNDPKGNNSSSNNSSFNFNLITDQVPMVIHHKKPLVDTSLSKKLIPETTVPASPSLCEEDIKADEFLDLVYKKRDSSEDDDFTVPSKQVVKYDLMQQLSIPSTSIDIEILFTLPVIDKK
ncbi:hypothetical protein C1645_820816 [Glomus cerebriforme]|uniref:Uncharacterized protein n=1 Tax=Glomus cerebriforme TaxID=658196 RepID=A0A397T2J3_9GLOM|nr:hypothetical protein C1645_820816 [Glomus cerebriforme]